MTAPIFKATMSFDEAMAAIECARDFKVRRVGNSLFEVEIYSYYAEEEQE